MAVARRFVSAPPGGCAGEGGLDQVRFRHRVVADPGLDGSGESVGDELRDDLVVGIWEVGVGGPGHERKAVVGEVAYQRVVYSAVRRIVQGVLVYGHKPLDVIGNIPGGKAQHLDRKSTRLNSSHT